MTTTTPAGAKRRDLRIEGRFLPSDIEDLAALRRALLEMDVPPPTVAGIVGWLVGKVADHPDTTSAQTRATYRKILAELAARDLAAGDAAQNPRFARYVKLAAA